MVLKQTTMQMSQSYGLERKIVPIIVFLWEKVGLCVHRNPLDKKEWNISHFNSGMSVLTEIDTLEEAKFFMQELYDKGLQDWTFTLEEWSSEENKEVRYELKQVVDGLRETVRRI